MHHALSSAFRIGKHAGHNEEGQEHEAHDAGEQVEENLAIWRAPQADLDEVDGECDDG